MGSTRAGRICPVITAWVAQIGQTCTDLAFEVIDLADWRLPADDEAALPALVSAYSQPHTQAWSDRIRNAHAVIFVTPQYNWGYPAVLKNAIDHLYHEWRNKPAAIITYGGHGGDRCARQLRQVGAALKMRVVANTPAIRLPEAVIRGKQKVIAGRDFQPCEPQVKRALMALAAQASGCETLRARMHRIWRSLLATIT